MNLEKCLNPTHSPVSYTHLENGLLVLTAGKNVVRLLPPLNISVEDVEAGLNILVKVLKEYK